MPKHLFIAQQQGPLAGMRSFLESTKQIPLPQVVEKRKAILAKRTDDTRVAAYCKVFGLDSKRKGANVRKSADVVAEPQGKVITTTDGQQFLILDGKIVSFESASTDEDEVVEDEPVVETPKVTKRNSRKPKGGSTLFISKGAAWEILGADPTFEPNDPTAPATNGQLYRLNQAGRLSLS